MSGKGQKYYAVAEGRDPGVHTSWSSAQAATDGYSRNVHQSFKSYGEAERFVASGGAPSKQDWAMANGGQSSNGYKGSK